MKTTRIISFLICLIMVIGCVPMTISAEEPPSATTFDEIIDFEGLSKGSSVDADKVNAKLNHHDLFNVIYTKEGSKKIGSLTSLFFYKLFKPN